MLFRLPFDWKSPAGYFGCVLMQIPIALSVRELFLSVMLLFLGFCVSATTFISDLECNLTQLNTKLIARNGMTLTIGEQIENKIRTIELIRFHAEIRESVFSYFFFRNNSL